MKRTRDDENSECKRIKETRLKVTPDDDLAAVVRGAPEEAVLVLSAGKFECGVDVTSDQNLVLEGEKGTLLQATEERPTICVTGRLTIIGLRICHEKNDTLPIVSQLPTIQVMKGGSLVLDHCEVSSHGHGLEVLGGDVTLTDCVVSGTGGRAAALKEGARGVMERCEVTDTHGLVVDGQDSQLVMRECNVSNSLIDGLLVTDSAKAIGTKCFFFENGQMGVRVDGAGSEVSLEQCELYSNHEDGMLVQGGAKGFVGSCKVFKNRGAGVHVQEKSELSVKDSEVYDDQQGGVSITDGSRGFVSGCELYRNGESGLRVETSTVAMTDSKLHEQDGTGVLILDSAKTKVHDCEIFSNAAGEVRVEVSQMQMTDTRVQGVRDQASDVVIMHGGQAVLQNCTMQDTAVHLSDNAQALVDKCTMEGRADLIFTDGCTGSVRGCTFPDESHVVNEGSGAVNVQGCSNTEGDVVSVTAMPA